MKTSTPENILANILKVKRKIHKTCLAVDRDPESVKLLLATKTVPAELIQSCIRSGNSLFAEHKVQEFLQKIEALAGLDHEAHFIGHLQSNKVKYLIEHVSCIHSLDRMSLVKELNKRLIQTNRTMKVLVQVNTSGETSKFGIQPNELSSFLEKISSYPTIYVEGLMTIGLFSSSPDQVRPCFRLLKELADKTDCSNYENIKLKELSMGMSNDYMIAIEEGATIIRVGTSIFGQREYPDSFYWNESEQ